MPNLIRLRPGQKRARWVSPPFPIPDKVSRDEWLPLVEGMLEGSSSDRERLILGNVYLVLNVTGRFLYYWPQTERFKDDMIGEGLLALVNTINGVATLDESEWLGHKIIVRVRDAIQQRVNRDQAIITASFQTNRTRKSQGRPLEIESARPLYPDDKGRCDEGPVYVDIADSLDALLESDNEQLIDAVLSFLEVKHQINIEDLTPAEFNMVHKLVRIAKGEL